MKNWILLTLFAFVIAMQSITSAAAFSNLTSFDSTQAVYLDDYDDDDDFDDNDNDDDFDNDDDDDDL